MTLEQMLASAKGTKVRVHVQKCNPYEAEEMLRLFNIVGEITIEAKDSAGRMRTFYCGDLRTGQLDAWIVDAYRAAAQ